MSLKRLLFATVLLALVLGAVRNSSASVLNYLGRWIGMGWSDGYHAYNGCQGAACPGPVGNRPMPNGAYAGEWDAGAAYHGTVHQAPMVQGAMPPAFAPQMTPQAAPTPARQTPQPLPAPMNNSDRAARFPGYAPVPMMRPR